MGVSWGQIIFPYCDRYALPVIYGSWGRLESSLEEAGIIGREEDR